MDSRSEPPRTAEAILEQNDIETAIESASFGHVSAIGTPIASGMSPSATGARGRTALHDAVMLVGSPLIRLLMEAEVNLETQTPTTQQTALDLVATCGKSRVIELLHELGVDREYAGKNNQTERPSTSQPRRASSMP